MSDLLSYTLLFIPKHYFALSLPFRTRSFTPSLMLSTVNCLHTIWMVGMETDHGCGGGNHRCSCLDSPGFVCICVCHGAFSILEEKFHHCYEHLPQGRFIYFSRPVTQTRLHEQRRAHFLLVLIFLFF